MHTHLRASAAVSIAAAALLATSTEAAEPLVVRTYNNIGVTAEEMTDAREVADHILQGAGIRAVWRDCSEGCADAPGPRDVLVRIVAAPQGIAVESLGCAVIDVRHGTGTLATVFADRVSVVASRNGVDAGTLLGRAVAHEIGHLLLGTTRHSTGGLMRALWSDRELQRGMAADWTFAPADVARIGRGLDSDAHNRSIISDHEST